MELKEKLYSIFAEQIVGGSVVLIKEDEEFIYNYGFSSLKENKKVETDTIYRIASISKLIIGMAAFKLVEEGLLDIDQDISEILGFKIRNPKYTNNPITTRMLLLHTSSITDGSSEDNLGYNAVNGGHYFVSLDDLLTNENSKYYTNKTFFDSLPGEKYVYSNFGPGIIACIIEKASGLLFTEFVDKYFFKPLNMDASFKANNIMNKDKISDTFTNFETNKTAIDFIVGSYPDFSFGNNFRGPAGGLFVSMKNLSKIMVVLMNDGMYKNKSILREDTVDKLLNINFFASRVYKEKQAMLKGFTGGAYGICSVLYFSKEKRTGVCFIANGGNYKPASTGLNNIQEAIISLLVDEL